MYVQCTYVMEFFFVIYQKHSRQKLVQYPCNSLLHLEELFRHFPLPFVDNQNHLFFQVFQTSKKIKNLTLFFINVSTYSQNI